MPSGHVVFMQRWQLDRLGRDPYNPPFGQLVHFPIVQRSVGSAGAEALPDCLFVEAIA
jgi:hypothetical protein